METNGAILTRSSKVFSGMLIENDKLESSISARIRYHRQKAKIAQPELAKAVGCSRDRIFCYENGRTSEEKMDIELLKKMADYFGVDKYYFCNEYHVFIDTTDVPEYLKKMRKDKRMSQRKFANMLGIPLASYKGYEEGRVRIPEKYWYYIRHFQ